MLRVDNNQSIEVKDNLASQNEFIIEDTGMTISSVKLIKAIHSKDIIDVHNQLKAAVQDSIVLIKNPNALEQFSLMPRIGIARNAINTPIAKEKCTAATMVASYLINPAITVIEKKQWASILLDMLIIGCDYKQNNPQDNKNIIDYLFACQDIMELNQIREIYKEGKSDLKKLVEFKESNLLNVFPESPNYVSLARLSGNNGIVSQPVPQPRIPDRIVLIPVPGNSTNHNETGQQTSPTATTPLLSDSMTLSKKPINEDQEETSCCCWFFRG